MPEHCTVAPQRSVSLRAPNVRFGSLADVSRRSADVRYLEEASTTVNGDRLGQRVAVGNN
jgi:hypothetical protein